MAKNVKSMFFVLAFITLLVTLGAVCASDDTNVTAAVDSSVSDVASVSDTTSDTVAAEPVATINNDNQVDTKTLEKEVQKEKTIKEDSNDDVIISESVTITQSNLNQYNNRNWTVNQGVTVTSNQGITLYNVAITVAGNYVTLDKLNIYTNNNTKIIDATDAKNLTITDSILTLRNEGTSGNNQAIGIDLTNAENITITGTTLQVEAPSQTQQWDQDESENWYSTLEVSAILVNNADNINIDQNIIRILSTTEKVVNSTMPAITIKNGTENINVTFNTIYATGSHFVYGVMMNDGVTNAAIKNNNIQVVGLLYVAGVDASTANNSVVSGNTINIQSFGQETYNPDNSEESIAYGVLSNTYTTGNQNNKICDNTITPQANVIYAIEVYNGNNITVCSNHINEYTSAVKSIGVAFAYTDNSKIINNYIRVAGTTATPHLFYEEIPPVNTGIILTNQSNYNHIQGNTIRVTAIGDTAARSVNITNDTGNVVTDNRLEYQVAANEVCVGSETALVESGNSISNSVTPVLYPCDCGCMSTANQNMGINGVNSISVMKSLKKDLPDDIPDNVLIIDDNNVNRYGMAASFIPTISIFGTSFFNTNIIFNISMEKNISISGLPSTCKVLGDISNVSRTIAFGGVQLDNFYGPKASVYQIYSLTNSVVGSAYNFFTRYDIQSIAENNTIINNNLGTSLAINSFDVQSKNNYIVRIEGSTVQFARGLYINGENNTPDYDDGYALNNSNYDDYFDETNTLKSEYADSVLFATEIITKPLIINNKVTLSALRNVGGFNNVTFIEGSDNSIIEDTPINKLTLNGVNNIIVNRNTLVGEDSSIELIGSTECSIENNTINTQLPYTITLDENSFNNMIEFNDLYSSDKSGDKSISADKEQNTIQDNTPMPVPKLTITTYNFTVGSITNISASITLDDDILTNINKGKVAFKVNGKTLKDSTGKVIYANVIDGTATITDYEIPQSWGENATITATYSGSTQCEKLNSDETEIIITPTEPTITTEDINTTTNSQITLTANITDGNKQINSGKVVFKINGKTVKDENGKVIYAKVTNGTATIADYTLPESFKAGTYIITAIFTSSNYEEKLQTNSTLTISA